MHPVMMRSRDLKDRLTRKISHLNREDHIRVALFAERQAMSAGKAERCVDQFIAIELFLDGKLDETRICLLYGDYLRNARCCYSLCITMMTKHSIDFYDVEGTAQHLVNCIGDEQVGSNEIEAYLDELLDPDAMFENTVLK